MATFVERFRNLFQDRLVDPERARNESYKLGAGAVAKADVAEESVDLHNPAKPHRVMNTESRGAALEVQTIDVATAPLEQMQTHLRNLKTELNTELKQGVSASRRLDFYEQIVGYSAAIRDRQEGRSVDPVFRADALNLEVLVAKGLLNPEQNVIRREALYHGTVDPQVSAIHEAAATAERTTNTEHAIEHARLETPNRYAYLDAAIEQLTSVSRATGPIELAVRHSHLNAALGEVEQYLASASNATEVSQTWTTSQPQQTVFISQQRTQQVAIETPEAQRDFGVSL